jgi:feruloyl esterase
VDKANPSAGVKRTMPLCPFPAQAHYSGNGDVNAAANWSCPAGDRSLLAVGPVGVAAGMRSATK